MPKVHLGMIEQVPVREVWPHEALDFTKWLARDENLSQLGDACSIDLELIDTESSVGSFAVDIFAQEVGTDRKVIIENQLEDTNHDHLGKIITYAAGKGANVIIWVVARARDEHRKAVEWLNEHTDDGCSFFLVEIEVWRIGDSDMAPRFNVVESPNEWVRAERAKDGLTETRRTQLDYWQTYRDLATSNPEFSKTMRSRKALPQHWSDLGVGSSKYHLVLLINTKEKRIGVEVCVNDEELGKYVLGKQAELENALDLDGAPYAGRRQRSRGIRFYRNGCDIKGARDKWPEFITWQLEKVLVLRDAMRDIAMGFSEDSDK